MDTKEQEATLLNTFMDIQEATIEDLISELNKRPMKYLFCFIENKVHPSGEVYWHSSMNSQQAIDLGSLVVDYICAATDEFSEGDE